MNEWNCHEQGSNHSVARMPIALPYGLRHDELSITDANPHDFVGTMKLFNEVVTEHPRDEESAEMILRGAVCLFNRPANQHSFEDCLYQAIIWEVG